MPAPVIDVSDWEVVVVETNGEDETLWLADPATGISWMYKPPTIKNGFRQREDVAEYLACELAGLLHVPCATVQLAILDGENGCISRDLKPRRWEMQAGALLLADRDPNYQPGTDKPKGRPGHSLQRIAEALADVDLPPEHPVPAGFRAFDIFTGFLVLDAWIANRDRHDENWSVLLPPPGDNNLYLSPSYDHAGSLAYNVPDPVCAAKLTEPGAVQRWATKGTAWRFEYDPAAGPCTLVELAVDALQRCSEPARRYWLDSLTNVSHTTSVTGLLHDIPDMSPHWRTFAGEVLQTNQERLLHACRDL